MQEYNPRIATKLTFESIEPAKPYITKKAETKMTTHFVSAFFIYLIYLNPKTLARMLWRRPFLASPAHSALFASACLTLYVL